jgi:hypothetical protein
MQDVRPCPISISLHPFAFEMNVVFPATVTARTAIKRSLLELEPIVRMATGLKGGKENENLQRFLGQRQFKRGSKSNLSCSILVTFRCPDRDLYASILFCVITSDIIECKISKASHLIQELISAAPGTEKWAEGA